MPLYSVAFLTPLTGSTKWCRELSSVCSILLHMKAATAFSGKQLLLLACLSHCNSVCPSCHTGGSVKNGAS